MSRSGLEPETACVLDRRDNHLHHRDLMAGGFKSIDCKLLGKQYLISLLAIHTVLYMEPLIELNLRLRKKLKAAFIGWPFSPVSDRLIIEPVIIDANNGLYSIGEVPPIYGPRKVYSRNCDYFRVMERLLIMSANEVSLAISEYPPVERELIVSICIEYTCLFFSFSFQ